MRRKSVIALALMGALTLATTPAIAKPKPTLAEIEAAKVAEAAKKKAADAAAKKLAAANLTLRQLTAKANEARALYLKAQQELNVATAAANAAAKHAAETALAVSAAHRTIGKMAVSAYIMGGSLTDIQPLLSANGPQELVDQLSTLNTLGARNSTALERFKAAEIVARAAKKKADEARAIQGSIAEARAKGGLSAPASTASSEKNISGKIELSAELKSKIKSGDIVMVIARKPGERMPVAVLKAAVAAFPLNFVLNDSLAMSPNALISQLPEVSVEVRISKTGMAMPESGDLISAPQTIKVGTTNARLMIDQVRP